MFFSWLVVATIFGLHKHVAHGNLSFLTVAHTEHLFTVSSLSWLMFDSYITSLAFELHLSHCTLSPFCRSPRAILVFNPNRGVDFVVTTNTLADAVFSPTDIFTFMGNNSTTGSS